MNSKQCEQFLLTVPENKQENKNKNKKIDE